jgi:cytoskeletal protein RodZ
MAPIGDTLRQARMRQKLDIADVEARTKIRAKYLRALENEEFGVLPGPSTVRSFLRTYAETLGLDPHLLVEEYRASHEVEDDTDLQPLAGAPPAPERSGVRERRYTGRPPGRGALAIGAVVAVIAFLIVLGLVGGDNGNKSQQAAGRGTETGTQTASKPAPRKPQRRKPRANPTVATLRINPSVPTYACVDTGPGTPIVFEGILDQARGFKGKRVRVNLGKSSVALRANGRPLKIESTPNPIGVDVTPAGAKILPSGQRPCA